MCSEISKTKYFEEFCPTERIVQKENIKVKLELEGL